METRSRLLLALSVLVTTLASCGDGAPAKPAWVPVQSSLGRFHVSFPVQPRETTKSLTMGQFPVDMHVMGAQTADGREFVILWNDYPEEIMARTTPDRVLTNIRRGYDDGKKKILSEKEVPTPGGSGLDLEVDTGEGKFSRVRLLMQGRRLYQVMVYVPMGSKAEPAVGAFIDSFSISG